MAAHTADGAMLLVKKFGGMVLIFFGILCIAIGLEYRSTGLSVELIIVGIVALACGMGLLALKIIRRNAA
jgi:cyanate permease